MSPEEVHLSSFAGILSAPCRSSLTKSARTAERSGSDVEPKARYCGGCSSVGLAEDTTGGAPSAVQAGGKGWVNWPGDVSME